MKASRFSDAQKAFILKQGTDGIPMADVCRKAGTSSLGAIDVHDDLHGEFKAPLPRGLAIVKDFLEAGKKRLAGDTARAATSDEVIDLRREVTALKEVVADLTLENRLLKKSVTGGGEDGE